MSRPPKQEPAARVANGWVWASRTTPAVRQAVSCVLWELHENGPAVDRSGYAFRALRQRLEARGSPWAGRPDEASGHGVIHTMCVTYAGCLTRDRQGKHLYRLAVGIPPEQLPPNPFTARPIHIGPDDTAADVIARLQAERAEPPPLPLAIKGAAAAVDDYRQALTPELIGDVGALEAPDVLRAIRNLVDDALGPPAGALERLSDAVERIGELEGTVADLEGRLVERVREVEVLRRALAKRPPG